MTIYPESRWQWYAGADDEHLTIGPCATHDDAIREAIDQDVYTELEPDPCPLHHSAIQCMWPSCGCVRNKEWRISIHVCECVRPEPANMEIDGDRVLEDLDSRYEDFAFEEALFSDVSNEASRALSIELTATFHLWAERWKIKFSSWTFQEQRHDEDVVLPHPHPEESSC